MHQPSSHSVSRNEEGLFIEIPRMDYSIQKEVPEASVNRAVDSKMNEIDLDVHYSDGQWMITAPIFWLKKAAYPVTFELRTLPPNTFLSYV